MQWALALVAGVSASGALPELLQVDWRRIDDPPAQGPYQQGFQDSDCGWVDGRCGWRGCGVCGGGRVLRALLEMPLPLAAPGGAESSLILPSFRAGRPHLTLHPTGARATADA